MCVLVWGRVCVCGVLCVSCVGRWCGGVYTRTYTVHSQALRSHFVLKPHTMFGAGGWDLGQQGWDQQGRDQRQQGWDQQGWDQREQGMDDTREQGWVDRGRSGGRGGEAPRPTRHRGGEAPRQKWSTNCGKDYEDPGFGHNTKNPNAWCLDRDLHRAAALPATGLLVQPSDRQYATADAANEAKRQETQNPRGGHNHAFQPWAVLKVLWP